VKLQIGRQWAPKALTKIDLGLKIEKLARLHGKKQLKKELQFLWVQIQTSYHTVNGLHIQSATEWPT
jgi:hypothetical protein